jgi:hypothetical protein
MNRLPASILAAATLAAAAHAQSIARWPMDPTGANNPAVLDARLAVGEGVIFGNNLLITSPAEDHLWCFNSRSEIGGADNEYVASADVPPLELFENGDGGAFSYDASSILGVNGGLFYPVDEYGDEFLLSDAFGAFSVEGFFRTVDPADGMPADQSGAGNMQLLLNGEGSFKWSVILNEGGPGSMRFAVNDDMGVIAVCDVNNRNYADGEWNYFLAQYDPTIGAAGAIRLFVSRWDAGAMTGTTDSNEVELDAAYMGQRTDITAGNLFIGRQTFDNTVDPRTFLGLIDEVQYTNGLVDDNNRLGKLFENVTPDPFGPLAKWCMEPAPGLPDPLFGANPVTLDDLTDPDTQAGPDHLWSFSSIPAGGGSPVPDATNSLFTTQVPPANMFANGNTPGAASFDASVFDGFDGALFFPQDQYGNEFSFDTSFSLEIFFKTDGVQTTGNMALITQAGDGAFFRYGLILNEAGPDMGFLRFVINDGLGTFGIADLTVRNYADGLWHYALAEFEQGAGANGTGLLTLRVLNEDLSVDTVAVDVPASFGGLPVDTNDGNMFIGRNTFPLAGDPRTLIGCINKIQISRGIVDPADRIGDLPGAPAGGVCCFACDPAPVPGNCPDASGARRRRLPGRRRPGRLRGDRRDLPRRARLRRRHRPLPVPRRRQRRRLRPTSSTSPTSPPASAPASPTAPPAPRATSTATASWTCSTSPTSPPTSAATATDRVRGLDRGERAAPRPEAERRFPITAEPRSPHTMTIRRPGRVATLALLAASPCYGASPADVLDDAVAVWHMNDTTDARPPSSDLEVAGGHAEFGVELTGDELEASLAVGGDGKAVRLDDAALLVGQGAGGEINIAGDRLTLLLRFANTAGDWDVTLLSKHGGHELLQYNIFCFNMPGGDDLDLGLEVGSTTAFAKAPTVVPAAMTGGWHDVVARYDGRTLDLFFDGQRRASVPLAGDLRPASAVPLVIGGEPNANGSAANRRLTGLIDHAAIWDRALSDDEIASISAAHAAAPLYRERYRNQVHFSPARNWINDPNGLMYANGRYHLFYQHNPFGDRWGHMSWGHAVSTDLLHWEELDVAIPEANGVMAFSGSAVHDRDNTSGFGAPDDQPLVAIYTGHHSDPPRQDQRLAFSIDGGVAWENFPGNPVIDIDAEHFRDPKVLWHEPTQRWIMAVSLADQAICRFYASTNLRDWDHLSDFGPAGASPSPTGSAPNCSSSPSTATPTTPGGSCRSTSAPTGRPGDPPGSTSSGTSTARPSTTTTTPPPSSGSTTAPTATPPRPSTTCPTADTSGSRG